MQQNAQNEANMTPQQHAQQIAQMLQQAQQECRADLERISDPQARVLFQAVAESLNGLITALEDYRNGRERVKRPQHVPQVSTERDTQPPDRTDLAVDVDAAEPPPRLSHEIPRSGS